MLIENTPSRIKYTSVDGSQVTIRTVVPTYIPTPSTNIRAIDVSDMSSEQLADLTKTLSDYNAYVKQYRSMMLSFEDWCENSTNIRPEYKWRTFKSENIEEQ